MDELDREGRSEECGDQEHVQTAYLDMGTAGKPTSLTFTSRCTGYEVIKLTKIQETTAGQGSAATLPPGVEAVEECVARDVMVRSGYVDVKVRVGNGM